MAELNFGTYSTETSYIITKDGLFFNGCHNYGFWETDNENIVKVSECKWSTQICQTYLTSFDYAARILGGIKKYELEKNSHYEIVRIKQQTLIEKVKNNTEEHSCFKCRYLGWENVGDGMNPVCEQEPYIEDPSNNDSGLHKSEPTVGSKNDCYWFAEKEK